MKQGKRGGQRIGSLELGNLEQRADDAQQPLPNSVSLESLVALIHFFLTACVRRLIRNPAPLCRNVVSWAKPRHFLGHRWLHQFLYYVSCHACGRCALDSIASAVDSIASAVNSTASVSGWF